MVAENSRQRNKPTFVCCFQLVDNIKNGLGGGDTHAVVALVAADYKRWSCNNEVCFASDLLDYPHLILSLLC
jgi:hypothetical protein